MIFYYLLILISFLACTSKERLKVNYHSSNIYDVQVNDGKLFYYCTHPEKTEESRSWLAIYLFSEKETILFFTRRKLDVDECKDWLKEIDAVYIGARKIRIVGIEGDEKPFDDDNISEKLNRTQPTRITSSWFFSRIVTEKGCVGHFGEECATDYSEKRRFITP